MGDVEGFAKALQALLTGIPETHHSLIVSTFSEMIGTDWD